MGTIIDTDFFTHESRFIYVSQHSVPEFRLPILEPEPVGEHKLRPDSILLEEEVHEVAVVGRGVHPGPGVGLQHPPVEAVVDVGDPQGGADQLVAAEGGSQVLGK